MSEDGIKRRGFGSMSKERIKDIAAAGGRKAHAAGKAHKFTKEEASAAGRRSVEKRRQRKAEEANRG